MKSGLRNTAGFQTSCARPDAADLEDCLSLGLHEVPHTRWPVGEHSEIRPVCFHKGRALPLASGARSIRGAPTGRGAIIAQVSGRHPIISGHSRRTVVRF